MIEAANWATVARINGRAEEALSKGDFETYKDLMVLREEIIRIIKAEGRYEVWNS